MPPVDSQSDQRPVAKACRPHLFLCGKVKMLNLGGSVATQLTQRAVKRRFALAELQHWASMNEFD